MGLLATTSKKVKIVVQVPPEITTLELSNRIEEMIPNIFSHYAWILHNLDKNEDGSLKKPHFHIVGIYNGDRAKRLSTYLNLLSKMLEIDKNCISILPSINLSKDIRYLTHEDNPDKYPYNSDDVTSSSYSWYSENFNGLGVESELSFGELIAVMKSCSGKYLDIVSVLGLSQANKYNWVIKNLLTAYEFTPDGITKKEENEDE